MSEFRRSTLDEEKFLSDEFSQTRKTTSGLDNGLFELNPFQPENLSLTEYLTEQPVVIPQTKRNVNKSAKSTTTTENPSFACNHTGCNLKFTNRKELRKHKLTHRERKHKCEVPGCDSAFFEKSKLTRHMVVHSKAKQFECLECGKKFGYKANVKTHMRTHSGEKPFKCRIDNCPRRFAQASNRNAHEKTHERKKGKKTQQKRGAAQLSNDTEECSHLSKVAKTAAVLSPLKQSIGQIDTSSFSLVSPAKVGVTSELAGNDLGSMKSPQGTNLFNKPSEGADWWGETPQMNLDDIGYEDLLGECFDFDPLDTIYRDKDNFGM